MIGRWSDHSFDFERSIECFIFALRSGGDLFVLQIATLVGEIELCVDSLFYDHFFGCHFLFNLLELAVVGHGRVIAHCPLGLNTEDFVEIHPLWDRPVQIRRLGRQDPESLVVDRKIRL